MLLVFWLPLVRLEELASWLPHMNSDVLATGGAQDLIVGEDGCDTFQGSSGPYFEHGFLAPV